MTALVVAACACVVWVYLAVARGGFWRGRENDAVRGRDGHDPAVGTASGEAAVAAGAWPRVVAVIPARDEAELIGGTVASLLAQRYPGALSVIVVDDHSDDETGAAALRAAVDAGLADRVTVLAAPPLAAGWTGKLAALAHGIAHCSAHGSASTLRQGGPPTDPADRPEWLLLTDADIRYDVDAVAALVSSALENRLVLSSLMVGLRCESFAERTLIPAFVFFFQMLYPFAWVAEPHRRTAAAAGGCVLVRRAVLEAAGGIASIRGALIDDCALARRLKPFGPIRLALAARARSVRAYPAFDDIRRMVVRSAYAQLRFSPLRLVAVVVAMTIVFVAPVVLAFAARGPAQWLAIATWALMAALFVPMLQRYRVPLLLAPTLPLVAAVYLGFTVQSAWLHWRGRGGLWKGRVNGSDGMRVADAAGGAPDDGLGAHAGHVADRPVEAR